jgi:hypothetical protein
MRSTDPDLGLQPSVQASATAADVLDLALRVRDPEVIAELGAIADPRERAEHALAALRIGLLAMRSARGQVDATAVRGEVERLLVELRKGLDQHRDHLQHELGGALRTYFDPEDGRFEARVKALVQEDGELARVIRAHVEGSDSALAQTLARHVGIESPLLRSLDPTNTEGLVAGVQRLVEDALGAQRSAILGEFSLDNREGALARLVAELATSHGKLGESIAGQIEKVVREFSLDAEDSALSRLVARVERAQKQIADEFTLDSDTSALARLRAELVGLVEKQSQTNAEFQERVKIELATLTTRRETEARSTTHGDAFEAALVRWLDRRCHESGDIAKAVGNESGFIKNSRVGDATIELGPEHRAAGAKIVIEAKENAAYRLADARDEIAIARKNRGAEVGIFVLSAKSAREGFERFRVIGPDVFVIWDAEDLASDVFLEAALAVARALVTRSRQTEETSVDFDAFERAIRDVEKQIQGLGEIQTYAGTIESSTVKIRERARIMTANLERAVAALDHANEAARRDLAPDSE